MYNNFYIRFNYKNIIPFNLKKKKLRVHANIIASKPTNLYGFYIDGEVKFWYYYFGINGLKRDNVFLIKKFLNKKLGVFFISNFNMIEGKWSFPKIYEQYYKNYSFLKRKKFNLFKMNLINNNNYNNLNNIFYIKYYYSLKFYNIYKLNFLYNINLISNLKILKNNNILYKFKKLFKLPILYNIKKNITKTNLLKKLYTSSIIKPFKLFYWNWNFYMKRKIFKKKKIDLLWRKQKPFWYFQTKRGILEKESTLFFKKKRFFIKNKKILEKFYLLKNIINIIQFVKLNKAMNKLNKKNIIYLFYSFYLHFNFIRLYKNITKKKMKNKKLSIIINIKWKKEKFNWIKLIFNKSLIKKYNKKFYIKFFIILKKKIKKLYKYRLLNNNFILNNINKENLYYKNLYYQLYQIWLKYNKKKKKKKKIIKLYWLKKKYKEKFKKRFKQKNLYLLWLRYIIIKRNYNKYKL